jgi:hypothetical protein
MTHKRTCGGGLGACRSPSETTRQSPEIDHGHERGEEGLTPLNPRVRGRIPGGAPSDLVFHKVIPDPCQCLHDVSHGRGSHRAPGAVGGALGHDYGELGQGRLTEEQTIEFSTVFLYPLGWAVDEDQSARSQPPQIPFLCPLGWAVDEDSHLVRSDELGGVRRFYARSVGSWMKTC